MLWRRRCRKSCSCWVAQGSYPADLHARDTARLHEGLGSSGVANLHCSFTRTHALQSCVSCTVIFCARTTVNVASFAFDPESCPGSRARILRLPFCQRARYTNPGTKVSPPQSGTVAAAAAYFSPSRVLTAARNLDPPLRSAQEITYMLPSDDLTMETSWAFSADCVSETSRASE